MSDIQIDPRGYRFGASVSFVGAVVALILGATTPGIIVMTVLVLLFLPGATIGPQATLQAAVFKALIVPRIGKPTETESFRPPRFAQQMGFVMSLAAVGFGLASIEIGFLIFAALITAASFLNAVFGFCLGCEIYLLLKRLTTKTA